MKDVTENPYPYAPWPEYASEGWILDEDRALRDLMKGMTVTDIETGGKARKVEAWFGHPDIELREQKYPYVTVDLLQVQEGRERVHRGDAFFTEVPEWWKFEKLTSREVVYLTEMPTPVDLDYQISTWARNPRHDRQILQQMITGNRTMLRAGLLHTADKKVRRLDVLSHIKRDSVDQNSKRLFCNVFRVRISSEVPWGILGDNYYKLGAVAHVRVRNSAFSETDDKYAGVSANIFAGVVRGKGPKSEESVPVTIDGEPVTASLASHMRDQQLRDGDQVILSSEPRVPMPKHPGDYTHTIVSKRPAIR